MKNHSNTFADNEFERRLDPEFVPIIAGMPVRDYADIPATRRVMAELLATNLSEGHTSGVDVTDLQVSREDGPDVPVRLYRPDHPDTATALPCLLWIHGGGHILGDVSQDDQTLCHIARTAGCAVVSVQWRHAPEHPYPAELDDCVAALHWLVDRAEHLGIESKCLAVGGASSGAGTAAGVALLARDRGGPALVLQLLVYPMLDDRTSLPEGDSALPQSTRTWNHVSNRTAWRAYIGASAGGAAPIYAAPSRAENLADLPPAFIAVGELDLFIEEDIAYAKRLLGAGVSTELHVYPGAIHGFDAFGPDTELSRRFRRDRDEALQRAFARHLHTGQTSDVT